ncbi:uncharacterized protein LOC132204545 [Neocloeon triangulifer]|uniref:uncharacterized protein LOC132204545 n=1 Tax=Neocloeon triangulifer TaxID=2078957 RepID=UPI00286F0BC9|nr:uncharacterized protein LOC132204545 [Neocloeon triangulifer]
MKVILCATLLAVVCHQAVMAEGQGGQQKVAEWSDKSQASAVASTNSNDVPPSRQERAAKEVKKEKKEKKVRADNCKYVKGAWSECDPKTNMRTRTFTLKKGDPSNCEATRVIEKKCKKGKSGCQYEKGTWSSCTPTNQMSRTDRLKPGSDPSCEATRQVTRNCKNKQGKENKQKGNSNNRRNRQ